MQRFLAITLFSVLLLALGCAQQQAAPTTTPSEATQMVEVPPAPIEPVPQAEAPVAVAPSGAPAFDYEKCKRDCERIFSNDAPVLQECMLSCEMQKTGSLPPGYTVDAG